MLKLKASVTSVSDLDKFCEKTKDIGPIGEIQFVRIPAEDLILFELSRL